MRWRLAVLHGDVLQYLTAPVAGEFFLEQWPLVVDMLGRWGRPAIRLVSDDEGCTLRPAQDEGPVEWWEVEPAGVRKPTLRAAMSAAESMRH